MKKTELKKILNTEVDNWAKKPYSEFLDLALEMNVYYEQGEGDSYYQVEVTMLEYTEDYVHIAISVNDGGWRAFKPLSHDFLVYKDGRVDK
jgi:hypothetical protein